MTFDTKYVTSRQFDKNSEGADEPADELPAEATEESLFIFMLKGSESGLLVSARVESSFSTKA